MRTSFEGMEGMQGMTGLAAATFASGGRGLYPDRVDLPFVTVDLPVDSPPIYKPIASNRCWVNTFPASYWTTEWYCWLVLTEFVQVAGWTGFRLLPAWARNPLDDQTADWNSAAARTVVEKELTCLIKAARDERPDALAEILAQSGEFVSYFLNLLAIPDTHPKTARLLRIVNFVAGFCAMYYKGLYKRPRPSMICPALLPPISVPGHASFPSGHSTQAHLVAFCTMDLLSVRPDLAPLGDELTALADRIARNREIAGLHYCSDTQAGIELASGIRGLLADLRTAGGWYQAAFSEALAEWIPPLTAEPGA